MFKKRIGEAAMYEQLAEEASELAQAASKVARILRGENPTPVPLDMARLRVTEEYTDVFLVCDELDVDVDPRILQEKKERWKKRLEDAEKNKELFQEPFDDALRKALDDMKKHYEKSHQEKLQRELVMEHDYHNIWP